MLASKPSYSPTKLLVAASLCFASMVSIPTPAAAACQPGQAGCVIPVGEQAPPPPPPPQTTTTETTPIFDDDGGGIGWLPILLGILALGALAYFLIFDDDDPDSP